MREQAAWAKTESQLERTKVNPILRYFKIVHRPSENSTTGFVDDQTAANAWDNLLAHGNKFDFKSYRRWNLDTKSMIIYLFT
jgi:hypothetical protein